jgi:predicted nucleic acid-binding protein
MVLFDSNYMLHVLSHSVPGARPDDKKWVDKLVLKLQEANERIVIPTPVLGEVLVYADAATPQYLDIMHKATRFRIVPFDEIAGVKAAERLAGDLKSGLGKYGGATGHWAVIKVDRQIIAIAEVEKVKNIYSNDKKVKTLGERAGFVVINFDGLPAHLNPIS